MREKNERKIGREKRKEFLSIIHLFIVTCHPFGMDFKDRDIYTNSLLILIIFSLSSLFCCIFLFLFLFFSSSLFLLPLLSLSLFSCLNLHPHRLEKLLQKSVTSSSALNSTHPFSLSSGSSSFLLSAYSNRNAHFFFLAFTLFPSFQIRRKVHVYHRLIFSLLFNL